MGVSLPFKDAVT